MICRNLRSGPISAVLIFSLTAILLKLDLIQTLVNKFVLTAARFWLQRWLAIRTISHKIWLAVGINGSWKHLFLAWLFSWMISRRRREGSIFPSFFIVLWSYSRKICLNMSMEIQKIDRWSFFDCITELNLSSSCWPQKRCLMIYQQKSANKNTVHLKIGFIWKFSQEWLLWTVYTNGGSLRKKPQLPTVKYF